MTDNLTLDDITTAIKVIDKVRHAVADDPSRRNNDWLNNLDHTLATLLTLEAEATPASLPAAHEVIRRARTENCNEGGYVDSLLTAAEIYAERFPQHFDGANWSNPSYVFHKAASRLEVAGNEVNYYLLRSVAWFAQFNPFVFRAAAGVEDNDD